MLFCALRMGTMEDSSVILRYILDELLQRYIFFEREFFSVNNEANWPY